MCKGEDGRQCDESNLIRAAKIDPNAFGDIYMRYVERVYRYMRTQADSNEDAADLTQLVFLKALDALPGYRERGLPFAAWLFRISRNVANDFHRDKRRHTILSWQALPTGFHPIDPNDYGQEVLDLQVKQQELDQVRTLLEQLNREQRELIALRFFAGLTLSEIASVVKKSQGTVQRQMVSILQTLKQRYKEQYHGE